MVTRLLCNQHDDAGWLTPAIVAASATAAEVLLVRPWHCRARRLLLAGSPAWPASAAAAACDPG